MGISVMNVNQYKSDLRSIFAVMNKKQHCIMALHLGLRCCCLTASDVSLAIYVQFYLLNIMMYIDGRIDIEGVYKIRKDYLSYIDDNYKNTHDGNINDFLYTVKLVSMLCIYNDLMRTGKIDSFKTGVRITMISDYSAKLVTSFLLQSNSDLDKKQRGEFFQQELLWQIALGNSILKNA